MSGPYQSVFVSKFRAPNMTTAPSLFAPFAQIQRDVFATPKPALKDGSAVAYYKGWQFGFGACKGFALYNLSVPVGIHPEGSTITEETLNRYGYSAPDIYAGRSTDDTGELLAN